MMAEFRYPEACWYKGRNGCGQCLGLSVFVEDDASRVRLRPMTSRGRTLSCMIEIPWSVLAPLSRMLKPEKLRARIFAERAGGRGSFRWPKEAKHP